MIAARTGSFDLALVAAAAVVTLGAAILAAGRMYAATARVQSSV
jgi:hypothetical protein